MLAIENVSFSHQNKTVLRNITASFAPGEICGIIGANGSGKTTLLRLLIGSLKPTTGRITVDGVPLFSLPSHRQARKMAFVPQDTLSSFPFSVEELIRLGNPQRESKEEFDATLGLFDLTAQRYQSITTLSGGQRHRAHLARAWAQRTDFLLLDEPTAHLDISHQERLKKTIQMSARENQRGFIVALHDLAFAARLAHRLILLHDGDVLADGAPKNVLTSDNLKAAYQIDASMISVLTDLC